MSKDPKDLNGQLPPWQPLPLPETADADLLPPPSLSVSTPYNTQILENYTLSSRPNMYFNPSFPETLYEDELESHFSQLNMSPNPTHHYRNNMHNMMNNGGFESVVGNNYPSLGFDDYLRLKQYWSEELIDAYLRPQQGFLEGSENLMLLPRSSNLATNSWRGEEAMSLDHYQNIPTLCPGGFNNNGYLDVVPSNARNSCPTMYNVHSNGYNGENTNRYLLSSNSNDMVRSRQRMTNLNLSNLESLRGSIFAAAKDQYGCRFLQKRVEERKPEEIEMIYREVRLHVRELMVDQFGNFVMQKLFEVCNSQQMNQLLLLLTSDRHQLLAICVDSHGTRAMQKFLESLATEEQRVWLVSQLQHITLDLCKNNNGHHVIRHCLKFFKVRENKQILDVVVMHCIEIATDRSGCCVLQQCVEHAQGKHKDRLVDEITKNVLLLSENRYGNYVVQYLLGLRNRRITNDVLAHLKNNYVSLSMNKFGSNVVEKCLKEAADGVQVDQIILEIITHDNFLMVLQDSFGNYVAQSALGRAQGLIRDQMIRGIQHHYPSLHSHPHGKRVFARAKGSAKPRPA